CGRTARRGTGGASGLSRDPAVDARREPPRTPVLREARLALERRDPRRAVPAPPTRRRVLLHPRGAVRRRRPVPALELLDATLPELRRGLTSAAARTV